MPHAHIYERYRRWIPFWAAVALLNLAVGLALTADPARATDLETVRGWTAQWLFEGRDLYASPISGTDYPPHAILALSPIGLIPDSLAVPTWAAFNLLLLFAAPLLAARIVQPRGSWLDGACLAVFFLAWSGSKTLLQFTLLTLVLGLGALVLARRRPAWSGLCLGLALMKPQIGLPFLLWVLFTRRWKVAAFGAMVIAAGSLLWCLRVEANPVDVATRYVQILTLYYAREGSLVGVSQAGPLVARIVPSAASGLTAVLSLAALGVICVAGFRSGRNETSTFAAPAMAGVWSLLTFYHLTYSFVLLLPVTAVLLLTKDPRTARARNALFWTMQAGLVVDVPGLWRRFGSQVPSAAAADPLLADFYRVFLIAVFVALWAIHRRIVRQTT